MSAFDEAIELLGQMKEGNCKDWCRRDLATYLGASGQLPIAEELIRQMQDTSQADFAYIGIGVELSRKGRYEEAFTILEAVKDKYNRAGAYHPIAKMQAEKKEYALCAKTIEAVTTLTGDAGETIAECTFIAIKNGDKESAKNILATGYTNSGSVSIAATEAVLCLYEGDSDTSFAKMLMLNKDHAWSVYAKLLGYMDKWKDAEKAIEKIQNTSSQHFARQKLAVAIGSTGNLQGALTELSKIKKKDLVAEGARLVVTGMAENGHFDLALQVADTIGEAYQREQNNARAAITKLLVEKGEIPKATELMKRVPYPFRNQILEAFAAHCIKTGLTKEAHSFICKVTDNSSDEMNRYAKAKALAYLGSLTQV